ncbi:NACHT domain-containing protein [Micromonospora sp. WMMD967]|uniref:NACHT domain-containing protein n=1 Tax=Micromonospora sp. WMMD967 TaxID=3016101 RepID=UPI002415C665|nr:NACHT domain-containing protein [Micromonospora sp. WMMD967]MDG4839306.1 NACHT domain-containing protein [Micromonospora sp. WMMD967]
MGTVEMALLRLAGSVVAPAVQRWLGGRREQRERETPLIELIGAGIADDLGMRRAGRRLDDLVDTVYERLQPLIRRGEQALPDNEVAAALHAVADTLRDADLSDAAVFADHVDPALMATRLRRQLRDVPERAGLNEVAAQLYGTVLDECCTCLTQLVVQLPPFQGRATVQTLERLAAVADSLTQVLARLPVTSLDAPTGTSHDAHFRNRYLSHLLTVVDHLELFGVDVHRYRLRTPLSIAYISLAVTGGNTRNLRRGWFRWDPGLLRSDGGGDNASVRAEQALGDAARVLLRGDAGSGKTTLLQWIAVTAARQGFTGKLDDWNGRTPFLVRLRDHVSQPMPPPERFLDLIAATIAGLMPPGWVHRELGTGAILCVDGVDEVPEAQRRAVRDWLNGMLAAYPDLRVVVTSRPAAASARWLDAEGFTSVFLERMGPADVKALIRHWHEAVRGAVDLPCDAHLLPGYEQRLLAQLDGSAHLQNLAGSPLLCAMLCALNLDRDSNLPRDRMDVYQAALDMLLHRRDSQRGVPTEVPELTSRDQAQLLQEVAWWMTQNGRTELTRADAALRFARRLAGIRHITTPVASVLEHMIQRSGVLREPVPDRIDFVHRTFQEYLAAREAADQGHTGALLEHAHLDTWRETIILAAGHANAPVRKQLLSGLLKLAAERPKRARGLRLLAAACLETAPAVEPQLLAEIRSHLRALLPRSVAEARSLAAVGEPLLADLPADLSILSEAQAAATVRAVALVNGPDALATLARYGVDPRFRVQRQLITEWEYFDPTEYAVRVLAEAPLDGGEVTIRKTALLPELFWLRHLTRTVVKAEHKLDLAQLADVPHLTTVNLIAHGFVGDLAHLAEKPDLRNVWLDAGEQLLNLSTLRTLPALTDLVLWALAPDQDISALSKLARLDNLAVDGVEVDANILADLTALTYLHVSPSSGWDPAMLAPLRHLTQLALHACGEPCGGIHGLVEHIRRLNTITFLELGDCMWLTDLTALASIDTLNALKIDRSPVTDLGPLTGLPGLTWLSIGHSEHLFDLTPLAGLPELKDLWIWDSPPGLDLTPLHGKRLTVRLGRSVRLADTGRPNGLRIKRI